MPMITTFGEGLGDLKAEFGVERQRGGVIGFDAEGHRSVPGGAGGLNESHQEALAKPLSTRGGGDADISQLNLAGAEGVGRGGRQHRLSQLEERTGAGEGQAQDFPGKPGQRLAQASIQGGGVGRAENVTEEGTGELGIGNWGAEGAQANHRRVSLGKLVIAQDKRLAEVSQEGRHGGRMELGESREQVRGELGERQESHFARRE